MPHERTEEFSFKNFFIPLTSLKAVHFIVIIGLVVYFNSLFNGFVWDDFGYILNYPPLHSLNLQVLFGQNDFNQPDSYYRPLSALYFAILYTLVGNHALLYHLLLIIVCIINAVLVYFLFKKFFSILPSFFAGIVFLIHPLNAESVDYIAQTNSPLSFLFGMIALLIGCKKESYRKRDYFLISICLLISLLTKESGILFFILLFLYKYLYNRKESLQIFFTGAATVVLYLLLRMATIGIAIKPAVMIPVLQTTIVEKFISIPKIFAYYIVNLFYPNTISIDQLWTVKEITVPNFYLPLIVTLLFFGVLIGVGIYLRQSMYRKAYLFFLVWLAIGGVLLLPFLPLDMTVADRWFYFPMVGLLGIIGIFYQMLITKSSRLKSSISVVLIIIVLLSVRTIIRNADFHDAFVLYLHDSKISDNYDIEDNLAGEYYAMGNYREALTHYKKSVELFPYEVNYYNLAYCYSQLGEKQQAIDAYAQALRRKHYSSIPQKHLSITYTQYALTLLEVREYQKAKRIITVGLSEYPDSSDLKTELILAQGKLSAQSK